MGLRLSEALNPEEITGERPWPVYKMEIKSRGAAVEGVWRALEAEDWRDKLGLGSKRLQLTHKGVWAFPIGN